MAYSSTTQAVWAVAETDARGGTRRAATHSSHPDGNSGQAFYLSTIVVPPAAWFVNYAQPEDIGENITRVYAVTMQNPAAVPGDMVTITLVIASENDGTSPLYFLTVCVTGNAELGEACSAGADCKNGYCVDGVCCENGCGQPETIFGAAGSGVRGCVRMRVGSLRGRRLLHQRVHRPVRSV